MYLREDTLLQGGKYKIIRYISHGGFGCTYEAVNTTMRNRRVAIKELFVSDFCNRDSHTGMITVSTQSKLPLFEKLRNKFLDEAETIMDLNHPGIVRVTDAFEENGTAYYVMDYIDGYSLRDLVKRVGALSEQTALLYIRQVAEALQYVHSKNRLHLDIKPANIMVNSEGKAILIDFGVSKQYDEESGENTSSLMGHSPGYAPPEQANNKIGKFLPATDIYALGATLYNLLTGIVPPTSSELAAGEELPPIPATVSQATRRAVEESVILNKLARPQSVAEFLAILNGTQEESDATEIEDEGKTDINDEGATQYPDEAPEPIIVDIEPEIVEPQTPRRSYTWLWVAIVGIAVGISAVLGMRGCQSPTGGHPDVTDSTVIEVIADTTLTQDKGRGAPPVRNESNVKSETPQSSDESRDAPLVRETADSEKTKLEEENRRLREKLRQDSIEAVKQAETERKAQANKVSQPSLSGYINGHEWVDLGLSVKWATCNVGASSPSDYGNYYAWGETSTKSTYTDDNSTTYGKTLGDISGDARYDAARANWGGSWRMPTKAEYLELKNNCTWTWTSQKGVKGYKVSSKKNGNSIFLPAAGCRGGSSHGCAGEDGHYWSSTPNKSVTEGAYILYFNSSNRYADWLYRGHGRTVRPVCEYAVTEQPFIAKEESLRKDTTVSFTVEFYEQK